VSKLYALEPNPGMIRLAEKQRHRTKLNVEFLDLPGERIPLTDGAVDTVVSCLGSRHREQILRFDNAQLGHDIVNILRRREQGLNSGDDGSTGSSIA
jgi:hypothetical protein